MTQNSDLNSKSDSPKDARADDVFLWAYLHPRYWLTWLGVGLTWIPSLLPYSWIVAIGKVLGQASYYLADDRVHVTRVNLEKCFPELNNRERKQLLKKNFESVGVGIMEITMAWWWPTSRLEKLVHYKGLEHLNSESGTILMVMHFTTIELAGRMVTLRHSVDASYREHKNPVFEYIQRSMRHRFDPGSQLLHRRDMRGTMRSLRNGRIVWFSPDQDYGARHGIFVPFFNIPATTITSTSRLAKAGKAKVVPLVVTRLSDNPGYEFRVYPPLETIPSGDDYEDALVVNQFIEARIREHPEQYMWLHRRFKSRPEGEKDFYK
ncbi:LpxL/LpxP family Kdo(2)-lipid IV(A) lauroyl/palmitoleoyl acyltransferase [Endozoicomonas ascidiicola]|uniref:LpxL/LpxP family Kdo(2)-lipid IV(A) lauroyl/palmitoleoyl acyltransferase n=1 Tax=Endozoicomonas ascidiicola TaxID=1698521 RepID=UPI000B328D41|nr:LpxL/LpxP family Kdo(2)-lipid IV(A) lauroyl/palmitoleoyl acyltransferase [Endozoicomonas ascidiicola]